MSSQGTKHPASEISAAGTARGQYRRYRYTDINRIQTLPVYRRYLYTLTRSKKKKYTNSPESAFGGQQLMKGQRTNDTQANFFMTTGEFSLPRWRPPMMLFSDRTNEKIIAYRKREGELPMLFLFTIYKIKPKT